MAWETTTPFVTTALSYLSPSQPALLLTTIISQYPLQQPVSRILAQAALPTHPIGQLHVSCNFLSIKPFFSTESAGSFLYLEPGLLTAPNPTPQHAIVKPIPVFINKGSVLIPFSSSTLWYYFLIYPRRTKHIIAAYCSITPLPSLLELSKLVGRLLWSPSQSKCLSVP